MVLRMNGYLSFPLGLVPPNQAPVPSRQLPLPSHRLSSPSWSTSHILQTSTPLQYLTPEDQEMSESEKQIPVEKCLKLKCSQVQQHLMWWVWSDQHPKITQRLQWSHWQHPKQPQRTQEAQARKKGNKGNRQQTVQCQSKAHRCCQKNLSLLDQLFLLPMRKFQ